MSSGRFFAVQSKPKRSHTPFAFINTERFTTAEEALDDRDNWAQLSPGVDYRVVEVHVSTEITVVE